MKRLVFRLLVRLMRWLVRFYGCQESYIMLSHNVLTDGSPCVNISFRNNDRWAEYFWSAETGYSEGDNV